MSDPPHMRFESITLVHQLYIHQASTRFGDLGDTDEDHGDADELMYKPRKAMLSSRLHVCLVMLPVIPQMYLAMLPL